MFKIQLSHHAIKFKFLSGSSDLGWRQLVFLKIGSTSLVLRTVHQTEILTRDFPRFMWVTFWNRNRPTRAIPLNVQEFLNKVTANCRDCVRSTSISGFYKKSTNMNPCDDTVLAKGSNVNQSSQGTKWLCHFSRKLSLPFLQHHAAVTFPNFGNNPKKKTPTYRKDPWSNKNDLGFQAIW